MQIFHSSDTNVTYLTERQKTMTQWEPIRWNSIAIRGTCSGVTM